MDDIKRPPKMDLNGSGDQPEMPSKVSIPISQTSDSIEPGVPNRTSPMISPIDGEAPKAPSGPVSLEDLDVPEEGTKIGADKPVDKPVDPMFMPDPFELPDDDPLMQKSETPETPQTPKIDLSEAASSTPLAPEVTPQPAAPKSDIETSPHVYDPTANKTDIVPAAPETDNKLDATSGGASPAPDFSKNSSEPTSSHIGDKADNMPTSEIPAPPDLSDGKRGKVSQAPHDNPKHKKFSWMAVLVAFVLAIALAGGAGYAYYQNQMQETPAPAAQPAPKAEEKPDELSKEDFDSANSSLDKTLTDVEKTDEAINSDLTDTGLSL